NPRRIEVGIRRNDRGGLRRRRAAGVVAKEQRLCCQARREQRDGAKGNHAPIERYTVSRHRYLAARYRRLTAVGATPARHAPTAPATASVLPRDAPAKLPA